jgi:hypothetical protein
VRAHCCNIRSLDSEDRTDDGRLRVDCAARDDDGTDMNVPLVAGGVAAAVGIAAGVIAERVSHGNLEQERAGLDSQRAAGDAWISEANEHFSGEITADRLRGRDLDAQLEDYKLDNPPPADVGFYRNSAWGSHNQTPEASRDGFWGMTLGAGGAGGAVVGGMTWGMAADAGSRTGAAVGASMLALGVGVAAGSLISSWTH